MSKEHSKSGAKPAAVKPGQANPLVQLAILVAILVVMLNAGFFFLSNAYFDDRAKRFGIQELARLSSARVDFSVFTLVVGAATVLAATFPRHLGHLIAGVAAIGSLIAAFGALSSDLPGVLGVTLLLVAFVFGVLIVRSLSKSRAAWSCLVSLCLVYGVVMLFAAPKIRGLFGVGLWMALIVPGLLGVATAALGMIRSDYREQT